MQKYLTVISAVLSDAKRNEILEKNPARMLDLPLVQQTQQQIPSEEEARRFLNVLCNEPLQYEVFYVLAMFTGCRRGELCALKWSDFHLDGEQYLVTVSRSRSSVPGKGVVEGPTKNKHAQSFSVPTSPRLCATTVTRKSPMPRSGTCISAPICLPIQINPSFIRTRLPSTSGSFWMIMISQRPATCIPCGIFMSLPCSTAVWTSRRWRSWPVTVTRPFWNAPTVTRRWNASKGQLLKSPRHCSKAVLRISLSKTPPLSCHFHRILNFRK